MGQTRTHLCLQYRASSVRPIAVFTPKVAAFDPQQHHNDEPKNSVKNCGCRYLFNFTLSSFLQPSESCWLNCRTLSTGDHDFAGAWHLFTAKTSLRKNTSTSLYDFLSIPFLENPQILYVLELHIACLSEFFGNF